MNALRVRFLLFLLICFSVGCANISTPTGGRKDKIPPRLVSIDPADSLKNTRVSKIEMHFNEYITVSDASKEVQISPILAIPPTVTSLNKTVKVKIPDTLLEDNTTYRIAFGSAIKDVHEGNVFAHYTYTFSTGNYFDSLQLSGKIINAATGLPDTGVYVVLYSASKSDSAVVKEKPKYVLKAENDGSFTMRGLPEKSFRIYAIHDANNNLIYDGPPEMIGFIDRTVRPGDTSMAPIVLKTFTEKADSLKPKKTDSLKLNNKEEIGKERGGLAGRKQGGGSNDKAGLSYVTTIDTNNLSKRTFDITRPVELTFNKKANINKERINLTYDSEGVNITVPIAVDTDTVRKNVIKIKADWKENTVYTLRLLKGFAKDTGGTDILPSKYIFRTFQDEDYGKLQIHVPSKYFGKQYLLMIMADKDTMYLKPVLDTNIYLTRQKPASYTTRIIVDKNENGKWDTGDLFEKIQPEEVIPGPGEDKLRAGWEDIIDFEQKPQPQGLRGAATQPPPK